MLSKQQDSPTTHCSGNAKFTNPCSPQRNVEPSAAAEISHSVSVSQDEHRLPHWLLHISATSQSVKQIDQPQSSRHVSLCTQNLLFRTDYKASLKSNHKVPYMYILTRDSFKRITKRY